MNTRHRDNYPRMNCIVVFNKTKDRILFCKRQKDPFGGRLNFVGGKVEKGESSEDAAYRELYEKTGITQRQAILSGFLHSTVIDDVWSQATGLHCNPDDILDAVCLAVTAALDAHHLCETIPEEQQRDARGLQMQMVIPAI